MTGIMILAFAGCGNAARDEIETASLDIDENAMILDYETPSVMTIAKDASHQIEVEAETEASTATKEAREAVEDIASTSNTIEKASKIEDAKVMSKDEKNKVLKSIDNRKVTNKEELDDLVTLIDSNIASFDLRERDMMIKKYINSLYDLMNNLNSILGVVGYDLETVVETYNISVNDKTSIESIPNNYGTVKGFLLEVKEKGFFMNSLNDNKDFYIDLDLSNFLEKYRDYISPSMIAYIEFNNYEMNNTTLLSSNNLYDLDEIVTRINMLEDGLKLDEEYYNIMIDKYTSSLVYYYQLLLGLSHTQFVDSTNTFNEEILEKYIEIQEANEDTTIADVLEKTTLAIEANEMVYSDELKTMVGDYLNSLIYTSKTTKAIEDTLNAKFQLLEEPEEVEEETLTEEEEGSTEEETTKEDAKDSSKTKK